MNVLAVDGAGNWGPPAHRELLDTYLLFGDPALALTGVQYWHYFPIIFRSSDTP